MTRVAVDGRGIIGLVMALTAAGCHSDVVAPGPGVKTASERATPDFATHAISGSATGSAHVTVFSPSVPPGLSLRNSAFRAVKFANGSVTGQWQMVAGGTILHGPIDCLTIRLAE